MIYPSQPTQADYSHSSQKRRGHEAALRGEPRSSCPHKSQGHARSSWLSGWWMANEGKDFGERGGSYDRDAKKAGAKPADPRAAMRRNTQAMFKATKEAA